MSLLLLLVGAGVSDPAAGFVRHGSITGGIPSFSRDIPSFDRLPLPPIDRNVPTVDRADVPRITRQI